MSSESQVPQPLDPSILPRLDPEYAAFHQAHIAHLVPPHTIPWSPQIRNAPAVPGASAPLRVGRIADYDLMDTRCRVFTPPTEEPEGGWGVFIFFHGGGWTLGNIDSENTFCTNMCVRANCVVVSVDYRLAPENPYPAAVEDAVEALKWVYTHARTDLDANPNKIAVGGSSSGGNLATILALKAQLLTPPIPVIFQLLIVPVTDNTASAETLWKSNALTPWLSPARMEWFKAFYLPNKDDWTKWDASPIFAQEDMLRKLPPAWFGLAELDILCTEGEQYAERMRQVGVPVDVVVYKGAPHPIMAMDGVLSVGKRMVSDAAAALKKAF